MITKGFEKCSPSGKDWFHFGLVVGSLAVREDVLTAAPCPPVLRWVGGWGYQRESMWVPRHGFSQCSDFEMPALAWDWDWCEVEGQRRATLDMFMGMLETLAGWGEEQYFGHHQSRGSVS